MAGSLDHEMIEILAQPAERDEITGSPFQLSPSFMRSLHLRYKGKYKYIVYRNINTNTNTNTKWQLAFQGEVDATQTHNYRYNYTIQSWIRK